MKIKIVGTVILVMVVITAGASAFAITTAAPSSQVQNVEVHVMYADLMVYPSLAEVTSLSTIVFQGTVEEVLPSYRVAPKDIPNAKTVGYLMTDVIVRVNKVVYGSAEVTNTTITIPHTGGQQGNVKYLLEGSPISEKGKTYLFFVQLDTDNVYRLVGDTQGRFLIQNGKLTPVSDDAENFPAGKILKGMSIANLERDFRRLTNR